MGNLFIPQKLSVVFSKRKDTLDEKLSFISYFMPNGEIFKANSMDKWKDVDSETKIFDNEPQSGFIMGIGVTHGGQYSAAKFNVRLYSTKHDTEFEISMENLIELATYTSIDKRYISGDCVFAWNGNNLNLISTQDPRYEEIKRISNQFYNAQTETKKDGFSVGDLFVIKKHKKKTMINNILLYIGEHETPQTISNGDKIISKYLQFNNESKTFSLNIPNEKKHVFLRINDQNFSFKTSDIYITSDNLDNENIAYFGTSEEFLNQICDGNRYYLDYKQFSRVEELLNSKFIQEHMEPFHGDNLALTKISIKDYRERYNHYLLAEDNNLYYIEERTYSSPNIYLVTGYIEGKQQKGINNFTFQKINENDSERIQSLRVYFLKNSYASTSIIKQ